MILGSCGTLFKLFLGVWLTSIVILQIVVQSQPQLSSASSSDDRPKPTIPVTAEDSVKSIPDPVEASTEDALEQDEENITNDQSSTSDLDQSNTGLDQGDEPNVANEKDEDLEIDNETEVVSTDDGDATPDVEEQDDQPTWKELILSGSSEPLLVQPEPLASADLESSSSQIFQSVNSQGEALDKVFVVDETVIIGGLQDAEEQAEMLAHVPMMDHPKPQRVLIIGDTTVGIVNQVLKHASVKQLDHIVANSKVMDLIQMYYFPNADNLSNSRYKMHDAGLDSLEFLQSLRPREKYDVLVYVPITPAQSMIAEEWWKLARQHLTRQGVLFVSLPDETVLAEWQHQAAAANFQTIRQGTNFVLCNPGKKSTKPHKALPKRLSKLGNLQYYSLDVQSEILQVV